MGEEDGRPDMVNRDPNGINNGLMVSAHFSKLCNKLRLKTL